jgi:hypothetical protein
MPKAAPKRGATPKVRAYARPGGGGRKNVYADLALLGYVQAQATLKRRAFSQEVVELLEAGVVARDGEIAMHRIRQART